MGSAAPVNSDLVAAEAPGGTEHKNNQATEASQTASEFVEIPNRIIVELCANISLQAISTLNYNWKLTLAKLSHTCVLAPCS